MSVSAGNSPPALPCYISAYSLLDSSYYYFNKDGSWYYSDGKPGNANAPGAAIYTTPRGQKIHQISPASLSESNGEYFIGVDWKTKFEKIYCDTGKGKIVRVLRKSVGMDGLKKLQVRTLLGSDRKEMTVEVDDDGVYHGDDPQIHRAIKIAIMREERSPRRRLFVNMRRLSAPEAPPEVEVIKPEPEIKIEPNDDLGLYSA